MPISDLGWNHKVRPPVFEAYHRKRKINNEPVAEEMDVQVTDEVKRKCSRPSDYNWVDRPLNTLDVHTPARTQCDRSFQQNPESMQLVSTAHQTTESLEQAIRFQQRTSESQKQLLSTEEHIMDLCDETYSSIVVEHPNKIDNLVVDSSMESGWGTQNQPCQTEYCGVLSCVGGNKSPRTGSIRCFCRPFWEGMVEMVPYVSDYY